MSDRINLLIQQLREKFTLIQEQLKHERSENESLSSNVDSLKQELEVKNSEIADLKLNISELNSEIEVIKNEKAVINSDSKMSEERISELVEEIDFCIEQLKK